MTSTQIRQRVESILEFMQPYWEFVNCHMVNYLTDHHWEHFLSNEIKKEATSKANIRECIETQFWQSEREPTSRFLNTAEFIRKCKKYRLENFKEILKTTEDLKSLLTMHTNGKEKISIKDFMTDKKQHEVEITAELVNGMVNSQKGKDEARSNEFFIVDAGDGKGYLSSRLALQYGHKVLGIDANEMNTENALKRSRKLQCAWNGLVKRAELKNRGITPPRRGKKTQTDKDFTQTLPNKQYENYQTTAKFIDTSLNFENLLRDHFKVSNEKINICLTGLHTCGNLATTCLRVFHVQPNCKILCNIGCCYHFLHEAYTTSKWEHTKVPMSTITAPPIEDKFGFPMSNFVNEKQVRMGRNARMLASQSIERTLSTKDLPNITLFYRALLEVLIQRQYPKLFESNIESVQVGRIRKFQNFSDYVRQCARKTNLDELGNLNPTVLENLELEFEEQRTKLELFYLIRMLFAPILETIILLDRLLYLQELGYEQSYLVTAFDAIISPRHYAIIAVKN